MRNTWQQQWGLWRSLLMYYAIPGRMARMQRFYGQFIARDDLCFDIGAHVGNRLRVWHALGARTVALEPQPLFYRWLQDHFGNNARIQLVPQAVGASAGTATLHISSRTPTVTTLSPQWIADVSKDASFKHVQWDQQVSVPVTTLDALIAQFGTPAFCKIDVEGFELAALQGLSQALPALSFEYIAAAIPQALACVERLQQLGDYEYNYSPGETHRLQQSTWLDAEQMKGVLQGVKQGSGDVYARRK